MTLIVQQWKELVESERYHFKDRNSNPQILCSSMNRNDIFWWIKLIRRALLLGGLLLAFVALGELLRVGQSLYALHDWVGHAFVLTLLILSFWLLAGAIRFLRLKPRRLPDLPRIDLNQSSPQEVDLYRVSLPRHLERMLGSPVLSAEEESVAREYLPADSAAWSKCDAQELARLEREILAPLQEKLDKAAEQEIRGATLEVTTAVALSPWRSFDSLVVIARGLRMVFQIVEIYGSRPTTREQLEILRDIGKAVASVGILGAGQRMVENLASHLPLAGKVVDDMIQGIGAGFYINLAGWAARERCRALHPWEPEQAKEKLRSQIRRYARDMGKRLTVDLGPAVWDRLTRRFRSSHDREPDLREAFVRAAEQMDQEWDDKARQGGGLGDTLKGLWKNITPG